MLIKLKKLLNKNHDSYRAKLKEVEQNSFTKKWVSGRDPSSLEPLRFEMLGVKPGKFLKTVPKKITKDMSCFTFDKKNRLIAVTTYAEQVKDKKWIVFREFYEYQKYQIFCYSFGSAIDTKKDDVANLQKISCIDFNKKNQVTSVKQILFKRFEYTETLYKYKKNEISEVKIIWPELKIVRKISVKKDKDSLYLFEHTSNGLEQIYPD